MSGSDLTDKESQHRDLPAPVKGKAVAKVPDEFIGLVAFECLALSVAGGLVS